MKPSIFIAMPNLGTLRVGHTDNLLRWFMSGKYSLKWYPVSNVFPHDRARNQCHKTYMNTGTDEVMSGLSMHFEGGIDFERYDYMLFLDADTVPPVSVIDQLIETKRTKRGRFIGNSIAGLRHLRLWPDPVKMRCEGLRVSARIEPDGRVFHCGRMIRYINGYDAMELGFDNAFRSLQFTECDFCWCAHRVETNLILGMRLSAMLEALRINLF